MSRSVAWRRTLSDTASWRQDQGLQATIYIIREVGPTGFLLKEEGESKPYKAFLGDPHNCTCPSFRKDRELCKHLSWLLLKKFKVARTDPISWQLGLVEREITAILRGEETRRIERTRPETARKDERTDAPTGPNGKPALEQRDITEDDTCPICMEELLAKRQPVTYCKYGCGNSIHIRCMKVWAEHQTIEGKKDIDCPLCREQFGSIDYLREEYKNTTVPSLQRPRITQHPNSLCRGCNLSPITNKIYRCSVCREYHLCQKCFNSPIHTDHSFEYRQSVAGRWKAVQRNVTNGIALAPAVVSQLMSREIGNDDYDLLLQLERQNAEPSEMPESAIAALPVERVRVNSRYLAPGEQCCICLRAYRVSDLIKRLPCRHKFHKECVDNWLLHHHSTCPVDGNTIWSPLTEEGSVGRDRGRGRGQMRGQTRGQARGHRRAGGATLTEADNSAAEISFEMAGLGYSRGDTRTGYSRGDSTPSTSDWTTPLPLPQPTPYSHVPRRTGSWASSNPSAEPGDTVSLTEMNGSPSVEDVGPSAGELLSALFNHNTTDRLTEVPLTEAQLPLTDAQSSFMNSLDQLNNRTRGEAGMERRRNSQPGSNTNVPQSNVNDRRRQRNMALERKNRTNRTALNNRESSAVSITTHQPRDASSLFLGSAHGELLVESSHNEASSAPTTRIMRGSVPANHISRGSAPTNQRRRRPAVPAGAPLSNNNEARSALGDPSLTIGSGPAFPKTRSTNQTALSRIKTHSHPPISQVGSRSILELTGTGLA